jgi:hypothetical protein
MPLFLEVILNFPRDSIAKYLKATHVKEAESYLNTDSDTSAHSQK